MPELWAAASAQGAQKSEAAGIKIVGISCDPTDALAKMKGELHLPFPLLSEEDEQVIQRYGLRWGRAC